MSTEDLGIAELQKQSRKTLLAVSRRLFKDVLASVAHLQETGSVPDPAFVACVQLFISLYGGAKEVYRYTRLNPTTTMDWANGEGLPKQASRLRTIQRLSKHLFMHPPNEQLLTRLVEWALSVPQSTDASVYETPAWRTSPKDMQGWRELSTQTQGLVYNNFPMLGDLLSHTEAEVLRTPTLGRKSLREVKQWLAQFGLQLPSDREAVAPALRHWRVYWETLPTRMVINSAFEAWCLEKRVKTYGELARISEQELAEVFKNDPHGLQHIKEELRAKDLTLGMAFAW